MADFFENLVFSPDDVITFPDGIPGFENHTRFVIVPMPQCEPFSWLACVDGVNLRFAIINPLIFIPDYSPKISKEQLAELKIKDIHDLVLYTIVTIGRNPVESTVNLAGPIVFNKSARIGKQALIEDERYSTQDPIIRKSN
ncbi:MAG: flagellar assembly protein FliW [Chitinispirillales bacterium]|jgi:flagellar assembly factor FliW|nr:flagellar assembly protein FliW [Chitinispirillales bacterium]